LLSVGLGVLVQELLVNTLLLRDTCTTPGYCYDNRTSNKSLWLSSWSLKNISDIHSA